LVVVTRVAVSFKSPFTITDAGFVVPVYDPEPEPAHERNLYPDAGEAWMFTFCPESYQ
jgi:hypothetical protein